MDFTEKRAELVGSHFGDGSLIQRKGTDQLRFQLRGDAVADRAHYEQFIIPLCNELIGVPLLGRNVRTVFDKKLNGFRVTVESTRIREFFTTLEVPIGPKRELPIPEWIKADPRFSIAIVRGFFDTDGGICYRRNNQKKSRLPCVDVIKFVSISQKRIQDTSLILDSLHFKHYCRKYCQKNR